MPERVVRPGMRHLAVAASLVVAGLLIAIADQAPPQDQRPTFRTEANYVRVDVYATTRDGTPVNDLRREEFRLLEDRVPQTIDQFSPISIRSGGSPSIRSDPQSPEESRQAATDSRARVFVLFLDVMHVDGNASKIIARPLIDALRQLVGPDDLIALVTPQMRVQTLTFTRQLTRIENTLSTAWGARDRADVMDADERRYATCYPGVPRLPGERIAKDIGIAQEMILRHREDQTFDALEALVTYLRDVREERKAVITITNGWRVYTPNQSLTRALYSQGPSTPVAGFDPRTGQLSNAVDVSARPEAACEGDRFRLASMDHRPRFRELLDRANRANVSFYPVDPRGVVVFDDDIVPAAGVGQNPTIGPVEDNRRLGERHGSLRTMALDTDGVAVIETATFAPALQRITSDLSSYYLLGYYSTGRLDGKFHAISVSATRPGIEIRARRGYLAASSTTAPVVDSGVSAAAAAEKQAVTAALGSLAVITREPSLFLQAAIARPSGNVPSVWAVFEVGRAMTADWARGGEVDLLLIDAAGNTVGSVHAAFPQGTASELMTIAPRALTPGRYDLRVRAKGSGALGAANESTTVIVPASADGNGAMFFRRGPTTGNKEVPTADLRFRRSDTLRISIPVSTSTAPGSGRLLDRTGKELAVPVTVSPADESDGSRWLTARAVLAPLGAGDYLIEVNGTNAGAQQRTLTAFRVIP